MSYIAVALAQYQRLREQVLALDSELDERTLLDTLEGLTDLHEVVAAVVRFAMADEVLASGLRSRMKDLQQRLERLEDRALKQRAIARDVMAEAGIKKITAPDFTISLRAGSPSLVVADERHIPETYWRPQPPKLDRHALLGALKSGTSVPGVALQCPARIEREDKLMSFTTNQVRVLRRSLNRRYIRQREHRGRTFSYVESWHAINEANRIFGFDGWDRETVEARNIANRESKGVFLAVYMAKVRVTVRAGGVTVVREGHGSGEGRGASPGEAHDLAIKAAETDATKRALTTFGKPFGLGLYLIDKDTQRTGTTRSSSEVQILEDREVANADAPAKQSVERATPTEPGQTATEIPTEQLSRIDKSVLHIGAQKRTRDKHHLRYVASQPCLLCGRNPSDPHHLRFAQLSALGSKVSDEFTVPLCRTHHRQLHQSGNEAAWWNDLDMDPLTIAKDLWQQTRRS